jgi:molybdate transport system ATP-binding protein
MSAGTSPAVTPAGGAGGVDAEITLRLGALDLRVALRVAAGETVALLGPNGAGKTTVLRCLAGLRPIDAGSIRIAGTVVDDPAAGVFVPADRRRVGVVFQDYLLFAHLDALDNVAFGLRARGTGRGEARRQARAWLERLGLRDHLHDRPRTLSGGQAQRVALARALVTDPDLLLLDEPLAALDAATRTSVRRDLRRHLDDHPGARLLITHDPVDAHVLADRVVVIEAGRIVQTGTTAEITARPRSAYVAQLVGVNLVPGTLSATTLDAGDVRLSVGVDRAPDGAVLATIAPTAVALHRAPPAGSTRNRWATTVDTIDHHHERVRVTLAGPLRITAEITAGALAELDLRPGDAIWASVKATEIRTYPA